MNDWLRQHFARRPWWMNMLMVFCFFMAVFYMPWDFFVKPVSHDQEAWFGLLLYGWAAKLTEPIHWAIYAAGAYGFWRMSKWMWPWSAVYAGQVAIGMLLWGPLYRGGWRGWLGALAAFVPWALITAALWNAREWFERPQRRSLRERYGDWALVTGASAGIGAEFARQLAAQGISCILTARREDRLRKLAEQLERDYQIGTRVVVADLAQASGQDHLLQSVADADIGIFINNAGLGYAGRFDKQDTERLRTMVEVNCVAPMVLANRILPQMVQRGRGAMIVSGSVAGRQPLARHAIYSATKAFDLMFGEALWAELRNTGVDVLVLEPGPTESEFREVAGEIRELGEPAANVVGVAFEALGRQPSVISGWYNWLRANTVRFAPRPVIALAAEQFVLGQTPDEMR